MKLIKALGRKLQQLKEMITDEKGYQYNNALFEITEGIALADKIGDIELREKFINEFRVLHSFGYEAWKSYKDYCLTLITK